MGPSATIYPIAGLATLHQSHILLIHSDQKILDSVILSRCNCICFGNTSVLLFCLQFLSLLNQMDNSDFPPSTAPEYALPVNCQSTPEYSGLRCLHKYTNIRSYQRINVWQNPGPWAATDRIFDSSGNGKNLAGSLRPVFHASSNLFPHPTMGVSDKGAHKSLTSAPGYPLREQWRVGIEPTCRGLAFYKQVAYDYNLIIGIFPIFVNHISVMFTL